MNSPWVIVKMGQVEASSEKQVRLSNNIPLNREKMGVLAMRRNVLYINENALVQPAKSEISFIMIVEIELGFAYPD